MNYIIVDLEATCWEKRTNQQNEIIEIGAVLVNEKKEILSEFEQFVKPIKHPTLSIFCTELTSIQQKDVDQAPLFPEAVQQFLQWIGTEKNEYRLCSWGFYDKRQLENDCHLHSLDSSWTNKHISLKHQYTAIKQLKRNIGMKGALQLEQMNMDGTHHRGIDDARNITKIFLKHFDQWDFR